MNLLHGILLTFAFVSGDNQFRADYEYHSLAKGWFKFHKTPAQWYDARMQCDFEGAVLASPIDVDVTDVMHSIISKTELNSFGIHTGIHNTISPAKFHSIEGEPLKFIGKSNMFSEEYNSAPSCMHLVPQAGLVAGSCNDSLPYMCYKKKTTDLQVTQCGTIDKGYQLDTRTGHCYKFHVVAVTWKLAYLICNAEGGYLAIANSAIEAGVFKDIMAKYPAASIIGGYKGGAWLGFYDWNESNIWRTIHGQRLEDAGYNLWSNGQPDNYGSSSGPGQHCGIMFRTGLLDDGTCPARSPFLCEMDPHSVLQNNAQ